MLLEKMSFRVYLSTDTVFYTASSHFPFCSQNIKHSLILEIDRTCYLIIYTNFMSTYETKEFKWSYDALWWLSTSMLINTMMYCDALRCIVSSVFKSMPTMLYSYLPYHTKIIIKRHKRKQPKVIQLSWPS